MRTWLQVRRKLEVLQDIALQPSADELTHSPRLPAHDRGYYVLLRSNAPGEVIYGKDVPVAPR